MQNILDHYRDPENTGALEDATYVQKEHNPLCGDKITVYLLMENDLVKDVSFEGEGCAISQAAMSMFSEEIKGMTKSEIMPLNKDFIVDLMGIELSPTRLKCALLGLQAVQNAMK